MHALKGTWSGTWSGWQHFYPQSDQGVTETRQQFLDRMFDQPPLIGGHRIVPRWTWKWLWPWGRTETRVADTYEQREGYFVAAELLCFNLVDDPGDRGNPQHGLVTGFQRFVRGAVAERDVPIQGGKWQTQPHAKFSKVQEGTIQVVRQDRIGGEVRDDYHFVVRNSDEIDWILLSSHRTVAPFPRYHAKLAQGTLRRVTTLP